MAPHDLHRCSQYGAQAGEVSIRKKILVHQVKEGYGWIYSVHSRYQNVPSVLQPLLRSYPAEKDRGSF